MLLDLQIYSVTINFNFEAVLLLSDTIEVGEFWLRQDKSIAFRWKESVYHFDRGRVHSYSIAEEIQHTTHVMALTYFGIK
jgi:hypothetical protein